MLSAEKVHGRSRSYRIGGDVSLMRRRTGGGKWDCSTNSLYSLFGKERNERNERRRMLGKRKRQINKYKRRKANKHETRKIGASQKKRPASKNVLPKLLFSGHFLLHPLIVVDHYVYLIFFSSILLLCLPLKCFVLFFSFLPCSQQVPNTSMTWLGMIGNCYLASPSLIILFVPNSFAQPPRQYLLLNNKRLTKKTKNTKIALCCRDDGWSLDKSKIGLLSLYTAALAAALTIVEGRQIPLRNQAESHF